MSNDMHPYMQFLDARLAAGETLEQVRAAMESLFLPIQELCAYCSNKGTLLCDFIIGFEKLGTATVPSVFIRDAGVTKPSQYDYTGLDAQMFTCDRSICETCRAQGSPIFFCGKEGGVFVPDYCKEHANAVEADLPDMIMTEAQAQQIRMHGMMRLLTRHPCLK